MGEIHDMIGFEFRDVDMDGIDLVSGSYTINTGILPSSRSTSAHSNRASTVERLFTNGTITGPEYWIVQRITRSDRCNAAGRWGVYNTGTTNANGIGIGFVDSSTEFTLFVAGVLVGTSSGAAWSNATGYVTTYIHVDTHTDGGTVEVFKDSPNGTPAITYTLTAGDITTLSDLPNKWVWKETFVETYLVDDCVLLDATASGVVSVLNIAAPSIVVLAATADAFYMDQDSGTFDDINDRPPSATPIVLLVAGDKTSHTIDDADGAGYGAVYGMRMAAKVISDGTAGANCELGIRDGSGNEQTKSFTAPVDGHVHGLFLVAPDAGIWTSAKVDATEQFFGAVT